MSDNSVEVKRGVLPGQFCYVTHYDSLPFGPEGLPLDVATMTHVPDHPIFNSERDDVCDWDGQGVHVCDAKLTGMESAGDQLWKCEAMYWVDVIVLRAWCPLGW